MPKPKEKATKHHAAPPINDINVTPMVDGKPVEKVKHVTSQHGRRLTNRITDPGTFG